MKKIFSVIFTVVLVSLAIYGTVKTNSHKVNLTALTMDNVEALAFNEDFLPVGNGTQTLAEYVDGSGFCCTSGARTCAAKPCK